MDAREVIRRCRMLALCTEEPGFTTRTFLSSPMHQVHQLVSQWMEAAGMSVQVDAVGNLRGVYGEGTRLMIGSHLDTVPHAGAFDGVLGVMLAIALVEARPDCAIEVVAFSEEEGVRFGVPFIGSRALVGDPVMTPDVLEAIRVFGLDPEQIPKAAIGEDIHGYLEFHIEQGPVLASKNLRLGVVDRIVGQSRCEVAFTGKANHAGTTPMGLRHDALAAAAEWVTFVERYAATTPGLVATVGKLEVKSGASNVIPARVEATLDVRHGYDQTRCVAVTQIRAEGEAIAQRRGVGCTWHDRSSTPATAMATAMVQRLTQAAGHQAHIMASGAGHDAMIMASRVPAGMLFLRSPNGISHRPDETVLEEDVAAALELGARFLDDWGKHKNSRREGTAWLT